MPNVLLADSRCHRRKFEPKNLVPHVPLLMGFLKTQHSVFLVPDQGTFLYPAQVPVLCHIAPSLSWHLFLQRQGVQPAHNQKPPALSLFFHGNTDCPAILACQSFDRGLCFSVLQPSPELVVAPGCAEQSALGRMSESSTSSAFPLQPACHCHQTVSTAFMCTEDSWGWPWWMHWTGWFLGQEYVRTCTMHMKWHLKWPWL